MSAEKNLPSKQRTWKHWSACCNCRHFRMRFEEFHRFSWAYEILWHPLCPCASVCDTIFAGWKVNSIRKFDRKRPAYKNFSKYSTILFFFSFFFPCKRRILYSKKFSSAKNFVKSDRPAVRQEFIFVKRRSSLVALRSFGRCFVAYRWFSHSWIFLIPHL